MAKKQTAKQSVEKLAAHRYSLTSVKRLLEAREISVSIAHLSYIKSGEREAGDSLSAELATLAAELCK
jgi:hypothetical protein